MKLRKITSPTALLAFILMMGTSIILTIVPQGRIAYWSDWRLLGLSKTDWGNIHTLADRSDQYHLNLKTLIRELERLGVEATAEQTLKEIGAANQMGPMDIYESIKEGAAAAR